MKKQLQLFVAIAAIFVQTFESIAQVYDPSHSIIPPAPTAANLGKYGDIPVNLYTGIPDINVPIYTVSGLRINTPISLSYHAGGNKVDEIASWVGLGWSLNAGGVITRVVYGRPDEMTGGYQQTISTIPTSPINQSTNQTLLDQLSNNVKDGQPDEFFINVNGISGKFVIDGSGVAHTIPYMDIVITPTITSGDITQFQIVTEDGTKYLFSNVETTTPETTCSGDVTDNFGTYNSSWYLTTINSPNDEEVITFEYTSYSYSYTLNLSETETYPNGTGDCAGDPTTTKCLTTLSIGGKRLNTITAANTVVSFVVAGSARTDLPGDYALSKIIIKDINLNHVLSYKFSSSYFTTGGGILQNRLRLDKIEQEDANGNTLPTTEFTYNTTLLPARNNEAQDHWGFYNGATTNTTLLPKMVVNCTELSGANREPNETYMKASVLEKIKYPTGGSSEFIYESNKYGAIRTSSTTSADDAVTSQTETAGVYNITSSTEVTQTKTFSIDFGQYVKIDVDKSFTPDFGTAEVELKDPSGNIININPPGCNLVNLTATGTYTIKAIATGSDDEPSKAEIKVTYTTRNGVYKNLIGGGLRVKQVTTKDNYSSNDIITKYEYQLSDDETRSSGVLGNKPDYYSTGKVFKVTSPPCVYVICNNYNRTSSSQATLSASNGSPVVYKEVKIIYGTTGENGSILNKFTYHAPSGGGFPYAPLQSYDYKNGLLTEKIDYDKDANVITKTINTYTFESTANKTNVRGIKIGTLLSATCIDDQYIETQYFYTTEWFYLSQTKKQVFNTDHSGAYVETISDYFYENPVHIQLTKEITSNSNGDIFTTRRKYPNDYSPTVAATNPMAKALYQMANTKHIHNAVIEEFVSLTKSGSSTEKVIAGTISEFKVQGSNVILKSKDYQLETAAPLTITTAFTPSIVTSNVFLADNKYVIKLNYESYDDKFNLTQYSRPDDVPTSLIWNYNYQLPIAQVKNASENKIAYSSFEADNKGNWTYNVAGEITASPGSGLYAKTGNKYFNTSSNNISRSSISAGDYILSYWYKDSAPTVIFTGTTGVVTTTGETDAKGWTYKETKFTVISSGGILISGESKIDELRLYPFDGIMNTFAYNTLIGVTEICDENNVEAHFEFDEYNRLQWALDYDRQPLINYAYAYKTTVSETDQNLVKVAMALVSGLTKSDVSGNSASHDEVRRNFEFIDGLGRTIQTINRSQSFNSKDIVTPVVFDKFGRVAKAYLSYTISPSFLPSIIFRTDALTEQAYFYNNQSNIENSDYPYSETVFEPSPINRVIEESNPGVDWKLTSGHTLTTITRTNSSTEQVLNWKLNGSNQWEATSYFPENTLYVTETKDENGNMIAMFKDKAGRNICVYQQKAASVNTNNPLSTLKNQFAITYYIYDDMGNLALVVPPSAMTEMITSGTYLITNTIKQNWCTEYSYDKRHRLVEKSIPGSDVQYYVYDKLDRIILSQDGNLRSGNNWMFYKFDVLSRPILSGVYNNTTYTNRSSMQGYIDANFNVGSFKPYENRTATSYSTQQGYTNQALPTHDFAKMLIVNYYDDYDFDNNGSPDYTFYNDDGWGTTAFYRLRNKITDNKSRILNSDGTFSSTWLSDILFYDKKNNQIERRSIDHLGNTNMTLNAYDFINTLTKTKYTPSFTPPPGGGPVNGILKTYEYDRARRLLKIKEKNYSDSEIILADYKYNELGELIEKNLHSGNSGTTYLQSVDYQYNIRGWMKNINNATLNANGLTTDDNSDLFGLDLSYTNPLTADFDCAPQYNGNITMARWKTSGDATAHGYGYRYDQMNRIIKASYKDYTVFGGESVYTNANRFSMPEISYDDNGNILTMQQQGYSGSGPTFGDMDNLSYYYKGNLLIGVNDAVADITGGNDFSDFGVENTVDLNTPSTFEYLYDNNGNMRKDKHKSIDITYNILNLPALIYKNANNKIEYQYSVTGIKLQKKVTQSGTVTTTDYIDNHVYTNTVLAFFTSDEGRVVNNAGTRKYEYYIADHLGNNRVFFADNDNNGVPELLQSDDYYPFGLQINRGSITNSNEWLFNGNELENEIGLYWYSTKFRNLDPQIGRWMTKDPLIKQWVSPYNTFSNSPISKNDPEGANDGWIIDLETSVVTWDSNVNTESEFETSTYDKKKYSFGGADPYQLSDGTKIAYFEELEAFTITVKPLEKTPLTISMENAIYGYQHSWDGAKPYANTGNWEKYGPFAPDAFGISIGISTYFSIGQQESISIVIGNDGIQSYINYGVGGGVDVSSFITLDMFDTQSANTWRTDIAGTSVSGNLGFSTSSYGLFLGYSQSYDTENSTFTNSSRIYSLGVSRSIDKIDVGPYSGTVSRVQTFPIIGIKF